VVLVLAPMFAIFFITFPEHVRSRGAIAIGVRLLPLTGLLIVASAVSGALINTLARGHAVRECNACRLIG
jgi:hypothetical protein